ncbi:MAG: hypothetical protein JJU03_07825 [Idiomarina sp.]|nr:hypothetical protein [Idiomarina sp.]
MHFIVLLFAIFLVIIGAIMLGRPKVILTVLSRYSESMALHVLAVVVRLLLGGVLLLAASGSRFPATLEVIGWISIVAGLVVAVMGHRRFVKLMEWGMSVLPKYSSVIGMIAILLGVFLGYAVI